MADLYIIFCPLFIHLFVYRGVYWFSCFFRCETKNAISLYIQYIPKFKMAILGKTFKVALYYHTHQQWFEIGGSCLLWSITHDTGLSDFQNHFTVIKTAFFRLFRFYLYSGLVLKLSVECFITFLASFFNNSQQRKFHFVKWLQVFKPGSHLLIKCKRKQHTHVQC